MEFSGSWLPTLKYITRLTLFSEKEWVREKCANFKSWKKGGFPLSQNKLFFRKLLRWGLRTKYKRILRQTAADDTGKNFKGVWKSVRNRLYKTIGSFLTNNKAYSAKLGHLFFLLQKKPFSFKTLLSASCLIFNSFPLKIAVALLSLQGKRWLIRKVQA